MEDRAGISVTRWLLQNKISAFHEEKIFINYTHTDGMRPANCYAGARGTLVVPRPCEQESQVTS